MKSQEAAGGLLLVKAAGVYVPHILYGSAMQSHNTQ
jgi:hypothetical protein